jgi:hypothetical protein
MMRKYFWLSVVLLVLSFSLLGQEYRATLVGRVLDSTGAAVPAAHVTATNTETGVRTSTDTNSEGNYTIPYLQPGTYRLRVECKGFKAFERGPIELRITDNVRIDLSLELGELSETINVAAETPLLDVVSASSGQVIDATRIAELPVAKGVPYHLMGLSPGMARRSGTMGDNPYDWDITNYAVGGSKDSSVITMDGAATGRSVSGGTVPSFSPPQETVSEFRVQTASFDATQGYTQSANLNIAFKSGTNSPHGAFYYSGSDADLAATPYFRKLRGLSAQDYSYHRLGGSFGGPVEIPKVYDGKNRTFFFIGPERIRFNQINARTYTVPTEQERTGDFSDLLKLGSQYQIYDPATRRAAPNGRFISDPLPGNVIPTSRLSPITLNMVKYWPLSNTAGTADGISNYASPTDGKEEWYWAIMARVDHNVNDRHRMFFSTHGYHRNNLDADAWKTGASGLTWEIDSRGLAFDDVYTFSPTFLMNVRLGLERFPRIVDYLPQSRTWSYADNGFPAYLDTFTPPEIRRMPTFSVSGYSSMPLYSGLSFDASDVYSPALNFTKIAGAHSLRFGWEGRLYRYTASNPGPGTTGSFSFSTDWTRGPYDNSTAAPMGQGLASALLGLPTGGGIARNATSADQSISSAFYLQDDWRVTSKLSLNLGLRYEIEGATTERYNRSVTDFDYSAALPIEAQVQANYANSPTSEVPPAQFKVRGGLRFAGVGGQSRSEWQADKNNLMPRFGFAYSLNNKTVVRGGYGIFFGVGGIRKNISNQTGFSLTTPLVPSLDGGLTFIATLANPFPDGYQNPPGSSLGAMTYVGQGITFFNPKPVSSYLQRWQFGFQRELPARILVDASYAGSRGTKLETTRNLDALPLQYLSTSPVRDNARNNYLTENVSNPFYPLLPRTNLSGTLVARQQLLLAYPQFTSVSWTTNEGYSWYHSLQVRVERRFADGFTAQTSYTWSKFMDATGFLNAADPTPERVISAQDVPHALSFNGIFELPFGRGRKLLPAIPRVVDYGIGGWQVEGIFRFQSGPALGFGNAIFNGDLKDIPLPTDQRTINRWFNVDAGFERGSSAQLVSNVRTLPSRFSGIRGNGIKSWDLSAIKKFNVREGISAEFRAEFFNAFNRVVLGSPNTTPSSTAFGTITSENGTPRNVTLGIRVKF